MAHNHAPAPASGNFDELDPHGTHAHSDHVIVGPMQLRTVLAVLLVFTALTVATAQLELWVMDYFGIILPAWLNVVGAMTIAVIKSLLVMAVFMQLKYDNPINTIVMAFTFAALAVFIIFTGMDLFNREKVYAYKQPQIIAGGMGLKAGTPVVADARNAEMERLRKEIAEKHPELKDAALEQAVAAAFAERKALFDHSHYHHSRAPHAAAHANSANYSRPARGRTDALSADAPHAHDGEHGAADHH